MTGLTIRNQLLPGGWVSLEVEGEVDLATVEELEAAISKSHTEDDGPLVVDLTKASFMDSTGLKALVMASRTFEESGRPFAIAVSPGPVSRLIDLSGVSASMRIVDSPEELVGA